MEIYKGIVSAKAIPVHAGSVHPGSVIVKYLFDTKQIGSTVSCGLNEKILKHKPGINNCFDEYNLAISGYPKTGLLAFIEEHIREIKGVFGCLALPCDVEPIRALLNKHIIPSFIVGLSCLSKQPLGISTNCHSGDCSRCQDKINWNSDITVIGSCLNQNMADHKDREAVFCVNTSFGRKIFDGVVSTGLISVRPIKQKLD